MFSFENTKNCGAAMLSCQSVSPVVLLQSDKSRHFLNFIQTKMWMFCTSGRRRRTKRWQSSSGWSWCLWNRSSKSHRVSERLKITHAHHLKETRALYVIMSLFSPLPLRQDPPKPKRQIPEPPPNKPSITKSGAAIIKDCCGATQCVVM